MPPEELHNALIATKDAALVTLSFLRESSDVFPPLKSASGCILYIAELVDTFHSNKKEWRNLALYLAKTINDFAIACERHKAPQDLLTDIDYLLSELESVKVTISKLASRSLISRVTQAKSDLSKIASLQSQIDRAMIRFTAFSSLSLRALNSNMGSLSISEADMPPNSDFASLVPERPRFFHGRESELHSILSTIKAEHERGSPARLVIRGAGGLGKTTLALAVFHHDDIRMLFGSNTYFVSCEASHTPSLLVTSMVHSLGLPNQDAADPLQQLRLFLQSSSSPILLLLDNFETPWYGENQEQIRKILLLLDSITCLTLLLTTRASELPLGIRWTKPILPLVTPFNLDAARATFVDVVGDHMCSPELDHLLLSLDLVPLAVTLMASLALSGDSIPDLQQAWEKESVTYLSGDSDSKDANIEVSIKISVESNPVKKNPLALRLLSVICHLPNGGSRDQLAEYTGLRNHESARRTLRATSLIYEEHSRLKVLSPIRAYILSRDDCSLHKDDKDALIRYYTELMKRGDCWPGDDKFLQTCENLRPEMGNIRSIVSLALLDGPPSLTFGQALFSYANFQCFTQPSLDPLKQLIDMKDWDHQFDAELRVKLIWLLGKIYQITKFPKECRDCFERARLLAKDANLPVAHACCLRDIGNFYSHLRDHATACTMLESAEKEFKLADTDSARGLAAACRRLIGGAKLALSHSDETLEYLKDVVLSLREFPGQRLSLAYALLDLAICHSRRSEHEEAISHAEQGYSMMQGLGWVQGDAQCLTLFAHVLCRAGQEEQAIALLKETVALHTCLGDRCQMADAYETMGMFYRKICQKEGFEMAFSRAIQLYDDLGMIESKADCLAGLALGERNVHDYLKGLEYDREARAIYLSQGSPSKAARCLMFECNALMVRKLVPHQELLAMFKQAREELLAAGDKDNAGWVMVTIAVCYYAAQEVEEGRAAAEVGLKELEDIGKHERAETGRRILQSIGYQPVTSFDAK